MTARRPRHATIVAYLALFVALGGSSFAITTARSGAQRAQQPSLRNTAAKPSPLASAGERASIAARGPRGPRGPRGRSGATRGVVRVAEVGPTTTAAGITGAIASCASGETATGGGFVSGTSSEIVSSFPVLTGTKPTGWAVQYSNYLPGRAAYAVCVAP